MAPTVCDMRWSTPDQLSRYVTPTITTVYTIADFMGVGQGVRKGLAAGEGRAANK